MLEIAPALALVLEAAQTLPSALAPLNKALGLTLAEPVRSDVDSPPHDASVVDGYAVLASDFTLGHAELAVLEEVTAGKVPTHQVTPGTATRIMTGAPLPPGANAVVMVEKSELLQGSGGPPRVRLHDSGLTPGQNIRRRASSIRRGEQVLNSGQELRPIEIGLLAEVGRTQVLVTPRPTVAILATGNELVPPGQTPAAGQIRNSNSSLLCALAERAGGCALDLGIGRDDAQELRTLMRQGLAADVLIISGGVSAGVLDLAPAVLAELNVRQVFHKVRLKPGQPLWFGVYARSSTATSPTQPGHTLVFGLPGNPVSGLVCFELFVRPALAQLLGQSPSAAGEKRAQLTASHQQRGTRPTYWPARLRRGPDAATITPLAWKGSGDLRTLAEANALAVFPAEERLFAAGEEIAVYPIG